MLRTARGGRPGNIIAVQDGHKNESEKLPNGICRVYKKRGKCLPDRPVIYSNAEFRKLANMLYALYTYVCGDCPCDKNFAGGFLDYYTFKRWAPGTVWRTAPGIFCSTRICC